MALVAHWPLTKDLNDTINGYEAIPAGISSFESSKLGNGLKLSPTGRLTIPTTVTDELFSKHGMNINFHDVSISVWMKSDILSADVSGGSFDNWIFQYGTYYGTDSGGIGLQSGSLMGYFRATGASGWTSTFSISSGLGIYNNGGWIHYVFNFVDSDKLNIYMNGNLINTRNFTTINSSDRSKEFVFGKNMDAQINDIRIYSHSLSEKEIKEIARAKILHYTFDDMREPTTNKFLQFTEDGLAPLSGDGGPTNLGLDSNNTFRGLRSVKFKTGTNGNFYINGSARIATDVTSTKWTTSIYIKRVDGAAITSVGTYMYITNNANNNTIINVEPVENGWYKVTRTRTGLTAGYPTLFGCYNLGSGVEYYVAMWQIEAKDHDTEYVKGSRAGKVNDYSGFFNHSQDLDENITPQWIPEAKIGSGAYKLNGNNYFLIHKYNASNDVSLSLWFKSDSPTSISQVVIGSPSSISFGIHNNTIIGMATNSAPVGLLSGSPYTVGQWNHIVITRDASNVMSYYINGIKTSNGSNNNWGWNDDPYGIIGRRTLGGAGSAYYTNGEIDDVRVYATTLSDEDILGLYRNRVSFDNKGNVFNYHIEQENLDSDQTIPNKFEVKSTGSINPTTINQIDHNLNQETTKQRLKEDGTLEIDGYIIQN